MQKQDNNIDKLLKRKLSELEVETSPLDWAAIAGRMDEEKKKPVGWFYGYWRYLAIILCLLLAGTGGYLLRPVDHAARPSVADVKATSSSKPRNGAASRDAHLRDSHPGSVPGHISGTAASQSIRGRSSLRSTLPSAPGFKGQSHISKRQPVVKNHLFDNDLASRVNGESTRAGAIHGRSPGINADSTTVGLGQVKFHARNTTTISGSVPDGRSSAETAQTNGGTVAGPDPVTGKMPLGDNNAVAEKKGVAPAISGKSDSNALAADSAKEAGAPDVLENDSAHKKVVDDTAARKLTVPIADNAKKAIAFFVKNPLNICLAFALDNSSHTLTANPSAADFTHKDYYGIRNGQEKSGIGYSAGIALEFRPWDKIIIQAGISTRTSAEKVNYDFARDKAPVYDTAGRIIGYITLHHPITSQYTHTNTYRYTSIPLLVGYRQKLSGRLSLLARAGASLEYFSSSSATVISPDDLSLQSVASQKIMRPANISWYGAAQVEYSVSKYFSLAAGPAFRQSQKSVYNDAASVSLKPQTTSFEFVIKFSPFK